MADQRAQRWHIPVSPEITQAIARTAELVFDYNATHPTHTEELDASAGWEIAHPIVVGKQAWLGAGVIVLPGVTIGERAVIGAGSVVTHDIPDDTIAYGNPARVIRTANPHTTYEL
ncbi:maltose acetyltransferase [Corynebacterium diphtheriae]|nr:maltose acetyltransferase [Corynebacterium diphtheriae]